MSEAVALLALLVAVAAWVLVAHGRLVRAQDRLHETWGELEDVLERRHDPAVALARRAQGRLGVPRDAAVRVQRLAQRSREAHGPEHTLRAERELDEALAGLMHAATLDEPGAEGQGGGREQFGRLNRLGVKAAEAAERYNEAARAMNALVEAAPHSYAATIFGYHKVPYYRPERPPQGA